MAYNINSDCINCGACVPECPTDCIGPGDPVHIINEPECISCGACVAVCPVDAIKEN